MLEPREIPSLTSPLRQSHDMMACARKQVPPTSLESACIIAGLFLVQSYYWLMDDAFVYFRYVDNLLFLNFGLVNNQGEYVEGFSSPAWVLVLIALRSLELEYPTIIRLLAFGCHLGWAFGIVRLNRHYSGDRRVFDLPLVYLTGCYGVVTYFSSGLETPLVLLSGVVVAAYITAPQQRRWQLLISLTPLVRQEFLLAWLVAVLWGSLVTRRIPWLALFALFAAVGGWFVFRVYYYADLLPNTFYLKDAVNFRQGLLYLHESLYVYYVYPVGAVLLGLAVTLIWRRQPGLCVAPRIVMLLAALVVTAYAVKVGGDARHFRFLAFPMCLAACSASGLVEIAWARWGRPRFTPAVIAAMVVLFVVVHLRYPPQLARHPLYFRTPSGLVNGIADAHYHRTLSALQYPSWSEKANIDRMRSFRASSPDGHYAGFRNSGWCYDAYENFDYYNIHSWGLTCAVLARTDMPIERVAHRPGLRRLSRDLLTVIGAAGSPGPGMYRTAVEKGVAPPWIIENLPALERIERQIYNRKHFRENLSLALSPTPWIHVRRLSTKPVESSKKQWDNDR